MAEPEVLQSEEEGVVTLEEKHLPETEETYIRASYRPMGELEDQRDSATQPLLQHTHQDSRDENHKADVQTATAGADPKTSVPQELQLAVRDQPDWSGSVRSLCSNGGQHECPICGELLASHGEHRSTLLNCDHTLCHRCITGIMRRARDPGRLRCPFCRQTTPLPQWEIRRLQEDSYSCGVYEGGPAFIVNPSPEIQAVPASPLCCFVLERQLQGRAHTDICRCCVYPSCLVRGQRLMRPHSLCFSISVLLLLCLVLLGCFLYTVVPLVILPVFFSDD